MERFTVEAELHARGLGAGLLGVGLGAENKFAGVRGCKGSGGGGGCGEDERGAIGREAGRGRCDGQRRGGGALDGGGERTFELEPFHGNDAGLLLAEAAVEHDEFIFAAALAEHGDADAVLAGREAEARFVGGGVVGIGGNDEVLDEGVVEEDGDAGGAGVFALEVDGFLAALADEGAADFGGEGVEAHEVVTGGEDGEFVGNVVFLEGEELDPAVAAVAEGVEADLGEAGGNTLRAARDGVGDNGLVEDFVGGGEVFLEKRGREGEDVADVVEAVAGVVGREVGGGFEIEADEVADGVVIFGAVEAAEGDSAGIGAGGVEFEELTFDERGDGLALGVGGKRGGVFGRHLVACDDAEDGFPGFAGGVDVGSGAVAVEGDAGFVDTVGVAVVAVFFEERGYGVLEGGGRRDGEKGRRGLGGEEGEGEQREEGGAGERGWAHGVAGDGRAEAPRYWRKLRSLSQSTKRWCHVETA